jgi:hypothetical protein
VLELTVSTVSIQPQRTEFTMEILTRGHRRRWARVPQLAGAKRALVESHVQQVRSDAEPPPRQCRRCRLMFEGDPTLYAPAMPDWWVCPPCRAALFGRDGGPNDEPPRRCTGGAL